MTDIPNVLVTVAIAPTLAQVAELLGPDTRLRLIKEESDAHPDVLVGVSYSLLLSAEQYALLDTHSSAPEGPDLGVCLGGMEPAPGATPLLS